MSALDAQIKSTIEHLNNFKPILTRLRTTTRLGAFPEFGKAIGGVIEAARGVNILYWHAHMSSDLKQLHPVAQNVAACIQVVYKVGPCSL